MRLKAKALWYLLTQACRGKAMVKKSEKFNGVHAWKILFDEYRPRMAGRFNAMLMGLLSPDWNNGMPFLDSLAAWDVECLEYTTQSGQQLTDATKIAVVTSHCPDAAKWVVRMASLQMGDDYKSFKAHLDLYFKQTLNFRQSPYCRHRVQSLQQDRTFSSTMLAQRWCTAKKWRPRCRQRQRHQEQRQRRCQR